MRTLKEARVGDTVQVVKLHGEGAVAPLGDPMELSVRGYELSLRKADAGMIEIA